MAAVSSASSFARWKGSSFYRESVENVVAYNTQLMNDRKARLPYFDSQTGIAQSNCLLWRRRVERYQGVFPGQVYSYPPLRWRKEAKPQKMRVAPKEHTPNGTSVVPGSGASGLVQSLEGGVVTKRSSRIAGMVRKESEGLAMPAGSRVLLESPASSELNEEDESPEVEVDFMDDYDSEEERKQRRRSRKPPARPKVPCLAHRPQKESDKEKPFVCSFCGRHYKTASSLKAHTTNYHSSRESSAPPAPAPPPPPPPPPPSLPPPPPPPVPQEKVPVVLPPPPNLVGKPCAKPNPYCDFCLGDSSINKKTGKGEKMVSCADCGRSAHPTCLQFPPPLAAVVLTYRWQCIECKSCHLCGTSDNDDQLLFCDDCDRGYHMYCLTPPIKEPPEGRWSCGLCLKPAATGVPFPPSKHPAP